METLAANAGKARRETMHGREYVVVPVVMARPGVMAGSAGPLYYPAEVLSQAPERWNGVPVVLRHPHENGVPVTARTPDVIGRQGLGTVFNAAWDGDRLRAEAWLEAALLEKHDAALPDAAKVLPRLDAGRAVEQSTGLFTANEPAAGGAAFNGTAYTHEVRGYLADHLAVLPDGPGACPVAGGCGLNVTNAAAGQPTLFGEDDMKRDALIKYLVTNCACGAKPEDAKKRFEGMKDDELAALRKKHVGGAVANALFAGQIAAKAGRLVANAEGEVAPGVAIADLAEFLGITIDPANDPGGFTKAILAALDEIRGKLAGEEPEPEEPKPEETPAAPAPAMNQKQKPKTAAEWLAEAPPEIRSAVANAQALEAQQRAAMVAHVLASLPSDGMRQAMRPVYERMDTATLTAVANAVPRQEQHAPPPAQPLWLGAAPAFNATQRDDSANLLPTFEADWSATASPALRKK